MLNNRENLHAGLTKRVGVAGLRKTIMRRFDEISAGVDGTIISQPSDTALDHASRYAGNVLRVIEAAAPLNVLQLNVKDEAEDFAGRSAISLHEYEYSEIEYTFKLIELGYPMAWVDAWVLKHCKNLTGLTARLSCKRWLSRFMRREKNRAREHLAILAGGTGRGRAVYCSDGGLARRREQQARNTAMMQAAIIAGDAGQQMTLYDVAQAGVSNKANRRAEVMTRIAGLEAIAKKQGRECLMITLTCPSRMHPNPSYGGYNNAYDATTPKQASEYLGGVWARIRSAFNRAGLKVYGMRASEPHKDACPHWHIVLWYDASAKPLGARYEHLNALDFIKLVCRRYALADNGHEAGADKRRAHFASVNKSAAGYVAKYVAKMTDGQGLGIDDIDEAAGVNEAVARADAWAGHWAIRAFQFFGTPSVQYWRTTRKLKAEAVHDASPIMRELWNAATSSNYEAFSEALGGDIVGKPQAFALDITVQDKATQYDGVQAVKKVLGIYLAAASALHTYETPRSAWVVVWGAIKRGQTLKDVVGGSTCPRINNCTGEKIETFAGGCEAIKKDVWAGEYPPW